MIWFNRFKKSRRNNECPQITLHNLRNHDVDIEWLMWKYKNLSKNRNNSYCLLALFIVEPNDTEEMAMEEKDEFIEGIKRKPSKKREYINYKTGTHLLWCNNKLIRLNSDKFDLTCFKETVTQTKNTKIIVKTYWAYIYPKIRNYHPIHD